MTKRIHFVALSAMLALACGGGGGTGPKGPGVVTPGTGVEVGDAKLLLGDTRAAVEARFGKPPAVADMGAAGIQVEYPAFRMGCLFSGTGGDAKVSAISLYDGFEWKTGAGPGIGSDRTAFEAAFGPAVQDPFAGMPHFGKAGMIVTLEDGVASAIHCVKAAP